MIFFRFIRIIFDRQTVQQTCYPFLYRLYYRHLSYPQKNTRVESSLIPFCFGGFLSWRRFSSLIIYCSFVIIMLFVCYFIRPVLCKATAIYSVFSCFLSDFGSASSRQAYVHVIKCTHPPSYIYSFQPRASLGHINHGWRFSTIYFHNFSIFFVVWRVVTPVQK